MKRGVSAGNIILVAVLTVVIIFIMALVYQQRAEAAEKTIFQKMFDRFFPSKIEKVVIPGTTAGAGCPTVQIDGADMIAQAILDCWKQGKNFGDNVPCCYVIDPKSVKTPFEKQDTLDALLRKPGGSDTKDFVWNIGTPRVTSGALPFTICFDYNAFDNEVYVTYNPTDDCD